MEIIADNCDKHHRRSIRLPDYDYASPDAYLVTTCVRAVVNGEMQLDDSGQITAESWCWYGHA